MGNETQVDKGFKRKKIKTEKKITRILLIIGGVLLSIYLMYIVYLLLIEPTNIYTVENGEISKQETNTGYVIRNEIICQGESYSNGIDNILSEGEKASKGEQIFRYYTSNEQELEQKISELDIKIEEALESEESIYPADIKLIDEKIDEKIKQINNVTDINELQDYEDDINDLILEKAKITGELSPQGSYLNSLIEERKIYETQLNNGYEYITAPMSGIVSYKIDGYEEILTPTSFTELTIEYLENLEIKTAEIIATNNEKGKIVDNFKYYIATPSNTEEAFAAEVGDGVEVRLASGRMLDAEIIQISKEEEQVLIILELQEGIEDLLDHRKITFDLIWWDYDGLKISNETILEKDGYNYVLRNRQGYINELLIKVLKQGDEYSIVRPYNTEELTEIGYTDIEIINYRKITIYDEILINANWEMLQ